MRSSPEFLLTFLWLLFQVSYVVGGQFKVKEHVTSPSGWFKRERSPADHVIELRIALVQPNITQLEKHLYEVSDPYHERYGLHLSKVDVEAYAAPHPSSVSAVAQWLSSHGIHENQTRYPSSGDWVKIRVPISTAERMLNTNYHVWSHVESGGTIVRTTEYSLPEELHEHIDLIQPTTMFAQLKPMKVSVHYSEAPARVLAQTDGSTITSASGTIVDSACNSSVTVSCLQQLYNTTGYVPAAANGTSIAFVGYLQQYANIQDVQQFYADQVPNAVNSTFEVISVNGGINNQSLSVAGIESTLDAEYAFGLTYPMPGIMYSVSGSPPFTPDLVTPTDTNEPYAEWLDYMLSHDDLPHTISTSYGDDEQTVPLSYAIRTCNDFAQLGARGVSLMFAAGDGGVGDGNPDPDTALCKTNDGRNATRFLPGFPGTCPYVTAVGGTVNVPEVAVNFSGGGFSDYFVRPAYQNQSVQAFLDQLPAGLYDGLYNQSGRAFPDISAQAANIHGILKGQPIVASGTSGSSPTFSAIIALLNDALIKQGRSPLGFLNPFLYSKGADGLIDITEGSNPGCGTQGFNATTGWDAVTGLGTPQFTRLLDIVLA